MAGYGHMDVIFNLNFTKNHYINRWLMSAYKIRARLDKLLAIHFRNWKFHAKFGHHYYFYQIIILLELVCFVSNSTKPCV